MRIGHGYDIHQLSSGNGMTMGGTFIACDYDVVAHSDGDVVIHALCDALLGALALGDIGQHFPDTDEQYANQSSRGFLQHIYQLIQQHGYQLENADVSVIAQTPKLQPHISNMREVLAEIMQVNVSQISLKATTNEKLDAIGQKQAVAAHALVLLSRKK